ncbi:hypothetical protein D6D01_07331 [Aureobasidium pullulans]|uniref:Uncharacterized protein n=1 Tax=Aureobasidium pullulans TaxID=5580 RepID=A0A4S9KR63_AURPU|nr:hypothetical protein D6D01_07331 [Aureobasidium pullulans]
MSNEPAIGTIHDYAGSNNPYIRGLYDEVYDYLLRLAEAWRPPTIRIGDLDSKFPGYAKGAQEASEMFGTCIQDLEDVLDVLDGLLNRGITTTLPDRFGNDKDPTTAGGMARTHAHQLATARRLKMRLGMTADETREADVRNCRAQISDAVHHFQDMQDAAYDLSEKYWVLLNQAGYESDDCLWRGRHVVPSIRRSTAAT